MSASRHAQLLVRSILAVVCGGVACADRSGDGGARDGAVRVGSGGGLAGAGGTRSGAAGDAGASGGGSPQAGGGGLGGGFVRGDHPCVAPVPILALGEPSGMVACADGSLARVGPTSCHLELSAEPACKAANDPPQGGGTARCDDPCFDGAHGRPKKPWGGSGYSCEYFCETDADCPKGDLCACGPTGAGTCVPGGCDGADACGPGAACRIAQRAGVCFGPTAVLRCSRKSDDCVNGEDCAGTGAARACGLFEGDALRCWSGAAGCGRPLCLADGARLARLVGGAAWT